MSMPDGVAAICEPGASGSMPGDESFEITGRSMTLYARVSALRDGAILERDDPADPHASMLYVEFNADHPQLDRLCYVWRTTPAADRVVDPGGENRDFLDGVMRLACPLGLLGDGPHDLVVRFDGPNLALYVDGVLVDEEWPHGELHAFRGPFRVGAGVERVAVWGRALTNHEIADLCGGGERVARRDVEILGRKRGVPNYWRPRGWNAFAGDCMLYANRDRLHLFWLYDRKQHTAKWHLGAHQYAHWSTTDLVRWEQHPMAVPLSEQWECAIGTGEFIAHEGTTYCFYTDLLGRCRFKDAPYEGDWIQCATSADDVHFKKAGCPVVPGWDSSVFRDDDGVFHLLTPGRAPSGKDGIVEYRSTDLRHWAVQPEPFLDAGGCCPHVFRWGEWWYLFIGNRTWRSRSLNGPWTEQRPAPLICMPFPKTAEFRGRRFAAAWQGDEGWGGDIVFRELIQHDDGSLGTKFVAEMMPPAGESIPLNPGCVEPITAVSVESPDGVAFREVTGLPRNLRITMTVRGTAERFGVCVRGESGYVGGCEVRFEPDGDRVQFGTPANGELAPESAKTCWESPGFRLDGVAGLGEPFRLDVVAIGELIDVCIGGRRTMITRRKDCGGDRLFLFVDRGRASFEDVEVRPLLAGGLSREQSSMSEAAPRT
jgi:hypothetical protein